jgi:hypothetical protein
MWTPILLLAMAQANLILMNNMKSKKKKRKKNKSVKDIKNNNYLY